MPYIAEFSITSDICLYESLAPHGYLCLCRQGVPNDHKTSCIFGNTEELIEHLMEDHLKHGHAVEPVLLDKLLNIAINEKA